MMPSNSPPPAKYTKDPDVLYTVVSNISDFIAGKRPQLLHDNNMNAYVLATIDAIAELGEERGVYLIVCKDTTHRIATIKECATRLSDLGEIPVRMRIVASEIDYNNQRFLFRTANQVISSYAARGISFDGILLNMTFDLLSKKYVGVINELRTHQCLNEWYTGITSN